MQGLQALQQILDQIEAELEGPLNVDRLASRAGYSRWHFQRLFAAATGTTPAGYIRARRLSEAALALRSSQSGILPLALKYGFESQAAFTRAFRQQFGLTPGAVRKSTSLLPLQEPLRLTSGGTMTTLTPEIIYEPARTVAGLSTRFISALSPQSNNLETIPALWARFQAVGQHLPVTETGLSLGVIDCAAESAGESGELTYLAAVPVSENTSLPDTFVVRQLPGGCYARFTHSGPLSEIGDTMRRIYVEWLPTSGYQLDERPELEVYDQRFRPDLGQTIFDVLIPLK